MKRFYSFILVAVIAFLVCGCKLSSELISRKKDLAQTKLAQQKNLLVINVYNSYSRTALPELDWQSYKYELIETTQSKTLLNKTSYDSLENGITLDPGKYNFILNAYSGNTKILSSTQQIDLTNGGKSILFNMQPVSGITGAAQVQINFPSDSPVASVKSIYTTDVLVSDSAATAVDIGHNGATNSVLFSKTNLPSDTEQYVKFWFYDSTNTLIYSRVESLLVVGTMTSYSIINITNDDWLSYFATVSVYLDNEKWPSPKNITLVDKSNPSRIYTPVRAYNNYNISISEGTYKVYIDDVYSGVEFESYKKSARIDYYTVSMAATSGTMLTPVSGGIDSTTNYSVVLKGNEFVYKLGLSQGYTQNSSFVITQNGKAISNPVLDSNITIASVNEPIVIAVTGLELAVYTITYNLSGGKWKNSYSAPTTFDAQHPAIIPTIADVQKKDALFDVWVLSGTSTAVKSTEGIYENLNLVAVWKSVPSVDEANSEVYANGVSLYICENSSNKSETNIYVDFNGNGQVDGDDYKLVSADSGISNFSNYTLRAGNEEGTEIKSDFTFTMTGGTIAAIYGLDSKDQKHENKSTLNISGNAKIGHTAPIVTVTNAETSPSKITTAATGVMLETITNERVNIVGQMTGDYSIVCISPYFYDKDVPHEVAYIGNSKWADLTRFTCFTPHNNHTAHNNAAYNHFDNDLLTIRDLIQNGVSRKIILFADTTGIALPTKTEIIGDVMTGFTLGNNRVATECSVFSISVTNGTFNIGRTTFTDPLGDYDVDAIEATLSYMAQPNPTSYIKKQSDLSSETPYIYMQILSTGNAITSEIASDFLSKITFKRQQSDKEIKIKVNLETVPAEDIREAEVYYFNGSFYKRVKFTGDMNSETWRWTDAYGYAKQQVFNNLHGYLMNITSEVENNYIYYCYDSEKLMSYVGGSRLIPIDEDNDGYPDWDKPVINPKMKNATTFDLTNSKWYWQSGPEAGQYFYNMISASTEENYNKGLVYDSNGNEIYTNWNNEFAKNAITANKGKKEPNNSSSECVIQYLANGTTNGYWNDQANYNGGKDYQSRGYFVEFTPYKTQYNEESANYQSITKESSY